ncbi:MAG: PD40 domain-containing protein [Planctomycetes bacterium]|nr:PD40 domain-containing protein [Planctomycetota bacterium]
MGPDTSVEWSPDGQYLAYASGYGHEPDLFVVGILSVETGRERLLRLNRIVRFGGHSFELHWSPDGRSLLALGRDKDYVGPRMDSQGLYRIDAQTGTVTPIIQAKNICPPDCVEWPVWSPNGTVIFVRWNGGYRSIVALESESGLEKEIYRAASSTRVSRLAVSPDGQRVAFVSNGSVGKTLLKVVSAAGGEARELLTLPALAGESPLAWTPDSRYIIYTVSSNGEKREFELWRIPADGGEPQNLDLSMKGLLPYGLSVHPDGRRIAFAAGTPARSEIWVMENFVPALKDGN